jgi:hypothetical protein
MEESLMKKRALTLCRAIATGVKVKRKRSVSRAEKLELLKLVLELARLLQWAITLWQRLSGN